MASKSKTRLENGTRIQRKNLAVITGSVVTIPDDKQLVHLQLRRFAGCPVCNLHLRSFIKRKGDLAQAGIKEVVVFYSTAEQLLAYEADLPFAVVADPNRELYDAFGVGTSVRAVLDPRTWPAIVRAIFMTVLAVIGRKQPPPPLNPEGGSLGLPGDFLIDTDGRIVASKYGEYAYDQWSVDEVLALAEPHASRQPAADSLGAIASA